MSSGWLWDPRREDRSGLQGLKKFGETANAGFAGYAGFLGGTKATARATAEARLLVERYERCAEVGGVAGPSTALRFAQDDKFEVSGGEPIQGFLHCAE